MDYEKLVQESHEIAKSKGWWETPPSFAASTLLMQSEISEALEDYRAKKALNEVWYESGNKPCGIPSELADVIIRIADFSGHWGLTLKKVTTLNQSTDFLTSLAWASMQISRAFDTLESRGLKGQEQLGMLSICLSLAIEHILVMCEANDIDIQKAIEEKTAFNRTRPTKHGGKKI